MHSQVRICGNRSRLGQKFCTVLTGLLARTPSGEQMTKTTVATHLTLGRSFPFDVGQELWSEDLEKGVVV